MNSPKAIPLKRVCFLSSGNSIKDEDKPLYMDPDSAVPYIATKDIDRETHRVEYNNGVFIKDFDETFRRAEAGDVLLCLEGGNAGRKVAQVDKTVAYVNKLCCIHPTGINPRFLYYVVQGSFFQQDFLSRMTGLIGGVSVSELGQITVPIPETDYQIAAASLLDEKVSLIDKTIDREIESCNLFRAYRKAVISELALKGLDPAIQMKETNSEWLNQVPVGWSQSRISEVHDRDITYGIIKLGDSPATGGVPVFRCSDVHEGYVDVSGLKTVTSELSNEFSRTILKGGEVLINVRGTLGGCAIVPQECAGWNIAREVAMIDVKKSISARFLMYYLSSNAFWSYLNAHLAGSVYQGLNIELLEKAPIYLPPHFEQEAIADELDRVVGKVDALIEKRSASIKSLLEARQALITEVVSCKHSLDELR